MSLSLNSLQKQITRLAAELSHAKRAVTREKESLLAAKRRLSFALEAQTIVQSVAEDIQQRAHQRIASLVSRCLHTVFGPDSYDFVIRFVKSRGKTEARLSLVRGELEVEPTEASGGGVVDVVGLGLRIACLMLHRPARRKLLCLDEPLRHLSANYRPAARELIEALSEELEIQFLIVTHDEEFRIGKVVELE